MKRLLTFGIIVLSAVLAGCSGSGNTITGQAGGGGGGTAEANSISLIVSSTQLGTQPGANPVIVTAQVKDVANAVIQGATVFFAATSGDITVTQQVTDPTGNAIAEVRNGGDPTNRTITVTATVLRPDGTSVQNSINIQVGTTRLRFIAGPAALAQGDSADYTVALEDELGQGIAGQLVGLTSALGNTISAGSTVTDSAGVVQFTYTATTAGTDTIGATALNSNVVASQTVDISNDSFSLAIAGGLTEIPLNTPTNVTVTWISGGVPVVGSPVNFATTRGVLTPTSGVTDGAGQVTVSIQAATAGPVLINATGQPSGPTTSISAEFIATIPANLDLQAEPLTIATGDQSTLTAQVTDANSNPVKNQVVDFSILLDPSSGSLSSPTAVTDSSGRAVTVYTAGATSTAQDGVQIQAVIQGTAITALENLTVARKELFISLGTGNDINEPNQAQFRKEWVVQVTDADGNAVNGVNVQVSINSLQWIQGCYVQGTTQWVQMVTAVCDDEDSNRNGVLDTFPTVPVDEDFNSNGRIEAGNIALVAAQGGIAGQAANVVTDITGSALVDVFYPQNYHGWVRVEIEAKASVAGTETRRTVSFVLDAKAADIVNLQASPPGQFSPFGRQVDGGQCTTAPEDPQPPCPAPP